VPTAIWDDHRFGGVPWAGRPTSGEPRLAWRRSSLLIRWIVERFTVNTHEIHVGLS